MNTTYYLRTLDPDGSEREVFTASSVKALAAIIYEISSRRTLGESDEFAIEHAASPRGPYVSTHFDIARVVDGEELPGLTEDEGKELDEEIARHGPPDEPSAWMSQPAPDDDG